MAEVFTGWGRKIEAEKQVTSRGGGGGVHLDDHELVTLTEYDPVLLQLVRLGKHSSFRDE